MQVKAHEALSTLLHPEMAHGLGNARVVEPFEPPIDPPIDPIEPPPGLDVGNRLDVEREEVLSFVALVHRSVTASPPKRNDSAYTRASSRSPHAAG